MHYEYNMNNKFPCFTTLGSYKGECNENLKWMVENKFTCRWGEVR